MNKSNKQTKSVRNKSGKRTEIQESVTSIKSVANPRYRNGPKPGKTARQSLEIAKEKKRNYPHPINRTAPGEESAESERIAKKRGRG